MEYRDSNFDNFDLSNLTWKFPKNGIESIKYPGYFYIPGYSRYSISRNGSLICELTGNQPKGSVHCQNYLYYHVRSDNPSIGSKATGRHRLLALTFIDNGISVENLDVNHINGKAGDDRIDNLEWCTRSENMLHAYENNLRRDNKQVLVTNVLSAEETIFFSAHDCERKLGLGRSNVHWRIKQGADKVFNGLMFRYLNSTSVNEPNSCPVICLNKVSGEILKFNSVYKCAKALGFSKKVLQKRFKHSDVVTFRNWEFKKDLTTNNCHVPE